ncbi:MAG: AAA family ATPase [Anaerolineae bacterium]|nr:MAG: AAA family ATPase [Anaerolineae bacterium]
MAKYVPRKFESTNGWTPPPINEFDEVGLSKGFMSDLILKTMYLRGQVTGFEIAESLSLPFQNVVHKILSFLKLEQMCEIKGSGGLGSGTFEYAITSKGTARAREQLERSAYVGHAPVPWSQYVDSVQKQGSRRLQVNESMMAEALSHLVLDASIFDKIGPAVNSGRSLFLYGPPGNGKTTIAESIGRMVLGNDMYIPYCVEVDGQIITVYDAINHEALVDDETTKIGSGNRDGRWIKIKRPNIMVGGELTMEGLDLVWDTTNKYYEAPFQMKANGGMFLIDDFGRQMIRPRDLLNRWIVPMEKNIDFLALHTGRKIELPFNVLLVFCTNLPPADLVDEAFLRRIRHKIHCTSPSFDSYREIFRRLCKARNIPEDEKALRYILQEYYIKKNRKLRASHPRDILDQLEDIGSYKGIKPTLVKELLDQAAESYFVDL